MKASIDSIAPLRNELSSGKGLTDFLKSEHKPVTVHYVQSSTLPSSMKNSVNTRPKVKRQRLKKEAPQVEKSDDVASLQKLQRSTLG